MSTSKTGKHGSAKCNITAIDIFNGKKYEDIQPSTAVCQIPFVKKIEYSLVDITEEGFCSLMNAEGEIREDIKLPDYPDNFGREIKTAFEEGKSLIVILQSAMGIDLIIAMKEETEAKA